MKTKFLTLLLLTSTLTAEHKCISALKRSTRLCILTHWHKLRLWDGTAGTNSDAMWANSSSKEMADAMIATGMKDAGYEYLVIDDCWQVGRRRRKYTGRSQTFSQWNESTGLIMCMPKDWKWEYIRVGSETCQGRPGSRGYPVSRCTYARRAWGIDYLKYDWCSNEGQKAEAAYRTMSDALKACGRPIVFSICEWGENEPWKWGKGIGHLWRITPDMPRDCYQCVFDWGGVGVLDIIDKMADLYPYADGTLERCRDVGSR